jgi:serine kinase of HPr protein (carbohydrate metabolism regulator)
MNDARETMHATLILIGEQGILIAGRSGHGKSSLALALLARARALGLHARLVGDDRISLRVAAGEVVGIAGVEGNGQSELLSAILHPSEPGCRAAGTVRVLGQDVSDWSTAQIRDLGVGVIAEGAAHRVDCATRAALALRDLPGRVAVLSRVRGATGR